MGEHQLIKPEIKAEWLRRLRDPETTQTHERLRDCKGFCGLGLLCDVVDPSGWEVRDFGNWAYRGRGALLPEEVLRAVSTSTAPDHLAYLREAFRMLIVKNDVDRLTFPELADYIEEHL